MARMRRISVIDATPEDVPGIVLVRTAAAEDLTARHGGGHWSRSPTVAAVLRALKTSRVLVAKRDGRVVGTVQLEAKKPWAIDVSSFSVVPKAIYVHALAVLPRVQGQGIGRLLIAESKKVAQAWPSDAIRLDAYDHAAGAAAFYAKCGFRQVGRATYRGVPLVYFEWLI